MAIIFDRRKHMRIVQHLFNPPTVSHCLIYENIIEVTPKFDTFARNHFISIEGISWSDLCAYRLPSDNEHLETLWSELAKSDLSWAQASQVVIDVWAWLDSNPDGHSIK